MKELIVTEKYNNKKLDKFIFDAFPNLSQNTFYRTLRKKDIRINDKRINENILVHTGDNIKLFISDELLEGKIDLNIIYEDNNILVVDKPSSIEVTGANSLTSLLSKKYNFISPAHRIDRNTTRTCVIC